MFKVEKAPANLSATVANTGRPKAAVTVAIENLEPGHMIRLPLAEFSIQNVRNKVQDARRATGKKYVTRTRDGDLLVIAAA